MPATGLVTPFERPGRNDPCACGSGRKFKKCCGVLPPGASNRVADLVAEAMRSAEQQAWPRAVQCLEAAAALQPGDGALLNNLGNALQQAKATTVVAMLNWLGVKPSYSRPRVSDDNAYAESLFRTAKYRPEFPAKGFADLQTARAWAAQFVRWYNHDHRHSGIRYVSPAQRHAGEDHAILGARHALYLQARAFKPARWSGKTRKWEPVGAVTLNPERDCVIKAHLEKVIQPMAA